jgi:hypothetical protein
VEQVAAEEAVTVAAAVELLLLQVIMYLSLLQAEGVAVQLIPMLMLMVLPLVAVVRAVMAEQRAVVTGPEEAPAMELPGGGSVVTALVPDGVPV